ADTITLGAGTNLVLGDDGRMVWDSNGNSSDLDLIESTSYGVGGSDTIDTGTGNNLIVGGHGDDGISGGSTSNVILGDSGRITAALLQTVATRFGGAAGLPITLARVETLANGIGGKDTITTNG